MGERDTSVLQVGGACLALVVSLLAAPVAVGLVIWLLTLMLGG